MVGTAGPAGTVGAAGDGIVGMDDAGTPAPTGGMGAGTLGATVFGSGCGGGVITGTAGFAAGTAGVAVGGFVSFSGSGGTLSEGVGEGGSTGRGRYLASGGSTVCG